MVNNHAIDSSITNYMGYENGNCCQNSKKIYDNVVAVES